MRLPRWHESQYDPWSGDLLDLLVAPFFWFVLPLVRGIVLLPFALLRPLFSSTRWVEAVCLGPPRREIVWRTTRADSRRAAAEIAARLKDGHALEVPGATLVDRVQ